MTLCVQNVPAPQLKQVIAGTIRPPEPEVPVYREDGVRIFDDSSESSGADDGTLYITAKGDRISAAFSNSGWPHGFEVSLDGVVVREGVIGATPRTLAAALGCSAGAAALEAIDGGRLQVRTEATAVVGHVVTEAIPPKPPDAGVDRVTAEVVPQQLRELLRFATTDRARVNIDGVVIQSALGVGYSYATNGHVLASFRSPGRATPEARPLLIPRDALPDAALDAASMRVASGQSVVVTTERGDFWGRRADPPPIDTLLGHYHPELPPPGLVVDRSMFRDAFRFFQAAKDRERPDGSGRRFQPIRVELGDGELELSADLITLQVSRAVPCRVKSRSEAPTSGFGIDVRYALDALSFFEEPEVLLHSTGELDPIIFRNREASRLVIVMPVRM